MRDEREVLLGVLGARHPDQARWSFRAPNGRTGAPAAAEVAAPGNASATSSGKLDRRQAALQDRGRAERREPELAPPPRARARRDPGRLLRAVHERLRHREVDGSCTARKWCRSPATSRGELEHVVEREVLGMLRRHAQAVPGREAPRGDPPAPRPPPRASRSRRRRRRRNVGAIDRAELRLDVVEVVEVDRLEPEVLAAAVDLVRAGMPGAMQWQPCGDLAPEARGRCRRTSP